MAAARLPKHHEEVSQHRPREAVMGLESGVGKALRTDYFLLQSPRCTATPTPSATGCAASAGTGRSLASPGQVAELVTAVRAWRELPHP
jgi:hypothetical protein